MHSLIFAFLYPEQAPWQATILAGSIRRFGGALAASPVWTLVPDLAAVDSPADLSTNTDLHSLDVRPIPFPIDAPALAFPLAAKVYAAAAAEAAATDQAGCLVWMDVDSIVVNEPKALLLEDNSVLGYRPVDHTLIGSLYDDPIDGFWRLIYEACDISEEDVFPMKSSVDEKWLRPYFNAGMLVARPGGGLLQRWRDNFDRLYRQPVFDPFYGQNILCKIFMHQAVLAGTVLALTNKASLQELPYLVNYPLHMHGDYPGHRRPERLNDVITCRYDTFFDDPAWESAIPIDEPLKSWLTGRLAAR